MKEKIEAIFENATNQGDALIEIYKLVFPDFDKINHIKGWPACGKKMWAFICKKFMDFDRKHHPGVMAGGIWLNNGFSSDGNLDDWEISTSSCSVN